jgi:hypothetical protein
MLHGRQRHLQLSEHHVALRECAFRRVEVGRVERRVCTADEHDRVIGSPDGDRGNAGRRAVRLEEPACRNPLSRQSRLEVVSMISRRSPASS